MDPLQAAPLHGGVLLERTIPPKGNPAPTNTPAIISLCLLSLRADAALTISRLLIDSFGLIDACILGCYIEKTTTYLTDPAIGKALGITGGWVPSDLKSLSRRLNLSEGILQRRIDRLSEAGTLESDNGAVKLDMEEISTVVARMAENKDLVKKNKKNKKKLDKKNKKNKKNILTRAYIEELINGLIEQFPRNWKRSEGFRSALRVYILHRSERDKKGLTPTACSRLVTKLTKYTIAQSTKALNDSVDNGWIGVFPSNHPAPQHRRKNEETNRQGSTGRYRHIKGTDFFSREA